MFRTRIHRLLIVMTGALLATGCALQAPRYQPSIDNVEVLKKTPSSMAVGVFTVQAGVGGPIGLRGSPMTSPVGADYAAYLADALQQELTLAGKIDPKSRIEISGLLMKNDIAAGGFSTNSGEIEARIIVTNNGTQRYDKVKRTDLSWESSFIGGVAIPKAQQQYPVIVQSLLAQLWGDTDFNAALK